MATHSNIVTCKSHRFRHDWNDLLHACKEDYSESNNTWEAFFSVGVWKEECWADDHIHLEEWLIFTKDQIIGKIMKRECVCVLSCFSVMWLFATLSTVALQAPLSMGFLRHEYWSGLLFPSPEDLPDPGIKLVSPTPAGGFFTTEPPGKPWC